MTDDRQRRRGRKQLIVVAILFLLPVASAIIATQMIPGFRPFGMANYGTLVTPVVPIDAAELEPLDERATDEMLLAGVWSLVVFSNQGCDPRCQEQLYLTRQIRTLLNKDSTRLQRLLVLSERESGTATVVELREQHPGLRVVYANSKLLTLFEVESTEPVASQRVFLIDPQGYLMMFYEPQFEPKSVLKDLKRLFKTSRLG